MTDIDREALLEHLRQFSVHAPSESPSAAVARAELADSLITHIEGGRFDVVSEWEYGHQSNHRDDGYVSSTGRTPSNWLHGMGAPYRRRAAVAVEAGPWELHDVPTTIALDRRPWLLPGTNPRYPHNRSAHDTGGLEWHPDKSYEQDRAAYGFRYAPCGRTDTHWPHSAGLLPYCNGIANRTERPA